MRFDATIYFNILTNMSKLLTIPRFWGPLATIVFTALYHAGVIYFGFTVAVGWLWIFAVVGAFVGGRRAGLISAAWAGLYAYYAMPTGNWEFTVQRVVIGFLLAGLVGWQTQNLRRALAEAQAALELARKNQAKADLVDSANGNIEKLRMALKMLDDLLMGWDVLDDGARRGLIMDIRRHLATLTLLVYGWRKLAQAKRYAEGEADVVGD